MYRAAILTDVHANLPALQAVLADLASWPVDTVYHLGDAVGIGPFPAETLDLLLAQPALRCVMGNHDALAVNGIPDDCEPGVAAHHRWVDGQLSSHQRAIMARWPYLLAEEHGGLRVSFLHYGFEDGKPGFAAIRQDPTLEEMDELFAGVPGELIWHGHHHPRADCFATRRRYVNPGALGCSLDAHARYARLTIETDGAHHIDLRAVPYDPEPVFRALAKRDVPEAAFIQRAFFGHAPQS